MENLISKCHLYGNHELRLNNMIGYIYKITNKLDNKIYIGMSANVKNRWKYGHLKTAQKLINDEDIGYKSLLYDAMKKYGIENFSIEVIEECPIEIMGDREQYWISTLNSCNTSIGYNICRGGTRGPGGPMFKGHKHSKETKEKMSAERTGKNNANYGNRWHHTSEMKYRYDGEHNPMFGKHQSDESKLKSSKSHSGRKRMSNDEIYPKFKLIKPEEIDNYIKSGWFLFKK